MVEGILVIGFVGLGGCDLPRQRSGQGYGSPGQPYHSGGQKRSSILPILSRCPVNTVTLEKSRFVVFPLNRIGHWALLRVLVQLKRLAVLASKSGSGLPVVGSADNQCSSLSLSNIDVPEISITVVCSRYHLLMDLLHF